MEQYTDVQQLMKKEDGKNRKPIYPPTVIQAVFDGKTGASLEAILAQFNSIYVQYQGTPKETRLIIPMEMRRAGLTITYMDMDSNTITERANSAVQKDNDHWALDVNWSRVDELALSGDISVSANGTWIINGVDTGVKAVGPKGDTGLTPWLKTIDNKLHFSYDNVTWEPCSENIAAWFRWNDNKIQISRDNKTWTDLSGKFADNVHIKGYVANYASLPSGAVQGEIYGVGPTYAAEDTAHTNPIYRYYVRNANSWVDNGQFTSLSAGVVQETGDSETEVMSQKAVSEKLSELESKPRNLYNISDFLRDTPSSNVRAGLLNSGVSEGYEISIKLSSDFFNQYVYALATTSERVDMTGVNVVQDSGWLTSNKSLVANSSARYGQIWFKRKDNGELHIDDILPYIETVKVAYPIQDNSIATSMIEDGGITSEKIKDSSISDSKIKDNGISAIKMGGFDEEQEIEIPNGATSGIIATFSIPMKVGMVVRAYLEDADNVLNRDENAATRPRLANDVQQFIPMGHSILVINKLSSAFEIQVPYASFRQENKVVVGGKIRLRLYNTYSSFQTDALESFETSIFRLNSDVVFRNKIQQLARATFVRNESKGKPLVLSWFSDLHADADNLARIVEFNSKYRPYIDDVINTGDTVNDNFDDDFSFYLNGGTSLYLHSIGNHEVKKGSSEVTLKGVYDKYLKPQIANWGVVQPQNAESLGLCYYYKDYADKGVRLIMFDSVLYMNYAASGIYEATWLENVLEDAITKNLSVVVATHYPTTGLFDNGFNTPFNSLKDQGREYDPVGNGIIATIDTYIKKGLKFICWLSGHTHLDMVGKVAYAETLGNSQLSIVVENAGCSDGWNDSARVKNTKSQDAFNLIAFDTYSKMVKIVRVGDDRDNFLRHKGTICISYDTHEITYED